MGPRQRRDSQSRRTFTAVRVFFTYSFVLLARCEGISPWHTNDLLLILVEGEAEVRALVLGRVVGFLALH